MVKQYKVLASTGVTTCNFTLEAASEPEFHCSMKQQVSRWLDTIGRTVTDLVSVDLISVRAV